MFVAPDMAAMELRVASLAVIGVNEVRNGKERAAYVCIKIKHVPAAKAMLMEVKAGRANTIAYLA